MTSNIDPTKPTSGQAFTADVRANFQAAHDEITALQAAGGGGGGYLPLDGSKSMTGTLTSGSAGMDSFVSYGGDFVCGQINLGFVVSGGGKLYRPPGQNTPLTLRATSGDAQPQFEDNDGTNQRPILDTILGDARYAPIGSTGGGGDFVPLDGSEPMTGPLTVGGDGIEYSAHSAAGSHKIGFNWTGFQLEIFIDGISVGVITTTPTP